MSAAHLHHGRPEFVPNMVRTFDDPDTHGVHMLFNECWVYSPARGQAVSNPIQELPYSIGP